MFVCVCVDCILTHTHDWCIHRTVHGAKASEKKQDGTYLSFIIFSCLYDCWQHRKTKLVKNYRACAWKPMASTTCTSVPVEVPVVHFDSVEQFHALVYPTRRPTVLKGVPLGSAPSLWTPDYLSERCGAQPAKLHVSPVPRMNFIQKNFVYRQVFSNLSTTEPFNCGAYLAR